MSERKVPKLRFPEFSGDWVTKNIGSVLSIGNGRDYKHLNSGSFPVFGTGGLMTHVDQYLYDGESVCIGRKGTIDKPVFINGKFWTVDTLFYTHSFINAAPRFVYNIFQKINWSLYNEATGVPSLSKTTIESIKVKLPCLLEEQTKIADFLTSVDDKIQQLAKKKELLEQYKKGVMQQIFSQQIRFKDDNDRDYPDWDAKHIGEVGRVSMCKRVLKDNTLPIGEIPFYKIGTFGKNADAYITKELYNKYSTRYPYPKLGDILVSASGTIGRTVIYDGKPAYFQDLNIVWIDNNEKLVKNKYLYYCYQCVRWDTEDTTIARLYNDNLRNININVPFLSEQNKIADFLIIVDDKIIQVNTQLEQIKIFKKSLLQQLFI